MRQIIWTQHAEERLRQWQMRFNLSESEIELCVLNPEQVVQEDDVQVAQSRYAGGLLRVVYADVALTRRIITLYWTNQVSRYWIEANYEN
jgi:hypothetical protein